MIELPVDLFPSLEGIFPKSISEDVFAYPTGSRHILTPPVTDTDEDYLIYSGPYQLGVFLERAGFDDEAETAPGAYDTSNNKFTSWRRGDLNLIVTNDREFASLYQVATQICAKFNVQDKADRIAIFEAIVDKRPERLIEEAKVEFTDIPY